MNNEIVIKRTDELDELDYLEMSLDTSLASYSISTTTTTTCLPSSDS